MTDHVAGPEPLVDRFGRVFDYLRVAVNERCNLRCVYCMPAEGLDFREGDELLTRDELRRVIAALASVGVSKIRFTGGEPLIRADITDLVADAAAVDGVESIHLTTNGVLLEAKAEALRDAGLTGVNVSLDTLDAAKFLKITRRTGIDRVLGGIHRALDLGFGTVKVNVVAMRGFNDDEVGAFVALTKEHPVTVRFIELMPFDAHQVWKRGHFFGAEWIIERLEALGASAPDQGTRTEHRVFRFDGHAGKVAVIPAYTRSLCSACNRLRLTANGKIRTCLYSKREHDLRDALRAGADAGDIITAFRDALSLKAIDGWAAQRETPDGDDDGARGSMTLIGG